MFKLRYLALQRSNVVALLCGHPIVAGRPAGRGRDSGGGVLDLRSSRPRTRYTRSRMERGRLLRPIPLAAIAMLAIAPFMPGRRPAGRWMVFSALLYTAVVSLLITAMTLSTAAIGILLQYTAPVWCALLAWLFQRRR